MNVFNNSTWKRKRKMCHWCGRIHSGGGWFCSPKCRKANAKARSQGGMKGFIQNEKAVLEASYQKLEAEHQNLERRIEAAIRILKPPS